MKAYESYPIHSLDDVFVGDMLISKTTSIVGSGLVYTVVNKNNFEIKTIYIMKNKNVLAHIHVLGERTLITYYDKLVND